VDAAGTDDDKEAWVVPVEHASDIRSAAFDESFADRTEGKLGAELSRQWQSLD
jgi:hypothetical protein